MPSRSAENPITLRLGHSPDPDDAFMWWPLFAIDGKPPRVDGGRFRFEPVTADIEALNQRAMAANTAGATASEVAAATESAVPSARSASAHGRTASPPGRGTRTSDDLLEITALSCAAYPFVKDRYVLTACGSSMGEGYGPKIIARTSHVSLEDLKRPGVVIAVPGERTTAFAAMSMLLGHDSFRHQTVPFKEIIDEVAAGKFVAGLIIHEGQLTFEASGLHQIVDLGAWWTDRSGGLPLPLGVNAIRRDLHALFGAGTVPEVAALLRKSVEYALAHREESVRYALRFARDMTSELADEFIRMYVNRWTLDFGKTGREAVRTFLRETHSAGLTPEAGEINFVG